MLWSFKSLAVQRVLSETIGVGNTETEHRQNNPAQSYITPLNYGIITRII